MIDTKSALIDVGESEEFDNILRTFILFTQTTREVIRYMDAHLFREAGLSTTQLIVLKALSHNQGTMTPSEISRWTQTERHNITTLVRRMKKAGLITSERSRKNKKNINIILTEKGREVLSHTLTVAQKIVDQVMKSVSVKDAILLEKLLKTMRQNAHSGLEHVYSSPTLRKA